MKTNIVFVGFDLPFLNNLAKQIADLMQYKFEDLSSQFDEMLLSSIGVPLEVDKPYLEARENLLYYLFSQKTQSVTAISADMYLASENYNLFRDSFVIYISSEKIKKLDKTIEKLLKKHVNLVLKQENLKFDDILNKFKG